MHLFRVTYSFVSHETLKTPDSSLGFSFGKICDFLAISAVDFLTIYKYNKAIEENKMLNTEQYQKLEEQRQERQMHLIDKEILRFLRIVNGSAGLGFLILSAWIVIKALEIIGGLF